MRETVALVSLKRKASLGLKTNPVEDGSCTGCTKLKFGIFPFVCKMRDKGTIERKSIWKKLSNRTSKSFAATLLGTKTM